jgi:hypothetical protein
MVDDSCYPFQCTPCILMLSTLEVFGGREFSWKRVRSRSRLRTWVIASPIFQLQNKAADGKALQPKTALLIVGISQPCIRRALWFADTIYLCLVNRYNQQGAPRNFSQRLSTRSPRQNPMQLANTVGQACRPRLKDMRRENLVHMSMTNC